MQPPDRIRIVLPKPQAGPVDERIYATIQIPDEQVRYLARKWASPQAYREYVNQTEQIEVWEAEGGAFQ